MHRREGGGKGKKVEGRTGAQRGGWGREAGGEGACKEGGEVERKEGRVEVGRGGFKCEGRGERQGRVMKRHPGVSNKGGGNT